MQPSVLTRACNTLPSNMEGSGEWLVSHCSATIEVLTALIIQLLRLSAEEWRHLERYSRLVQVQHEVLG
jgi:hypothetical protein